MIPAERRVGAGGAALLLVACAGGVGRWRETPPPAAAVAALEGAEALWAAGRRDEALRQYAAAARSAPAWVEANRVYQDRMLEAGRRDEVEGEYAGTLQGSRSARALILAGRLARSSSQAERLFREARGIGEGDPWVRYALGHFLAREGFSARGAGGGALGEATEELEAAVEARPEFPEALLLLAEVLDELGRARAATRTYRRYLALRPDDARARYNLAHLHHREGRHGEALREYRELVSRDPRSFRARVNAGQILEREGRHEEALREFRAALDLAPDEPEIHYNLGVLLEGPLNRRAEALSHYKTYLRLGGAYRFRVGEWVERLEKEGVRAPASAQGPSGEGGQILVAPRGCGFPVGPSPGPGGAAPPSRAESTSCCLEKVYCRIVLDTRPHPA